MKNDQNNLDELDLIIDYANLYAKDPTCDTTLRKVLITLSNIGSNYLHNEELKQIESIAYNEILDKLIKSEKRVIELETYQQGSIKDSFEDCDTQLNDKKKLQKNKKYYWNKLLKIKIFKGSAKG